MAHSACNMLDSCLEREWKVSLSPLLCSTPSSFSLPPSCPQERQKKPPPSSSLRPSQAFLFNQPCGCHTGFPFLSPPADFSYTPRFFSPSCLFFLFGFSERFKTFTPSPCPSATERVVFFCSRSYTDSRNGSLENPFPCPPAICPAELFFSPPQVAVLEAARGRHI